LKKEPIDIYLDSYFVELMPPDTVLDVIKERIDTEITKTETSFKNNMLAEGIFDNPAYRKTIEIYEKVFKVFEKHEKHYTNKMICVI
jgi:hypothetical protein